MKSIKYILISLFILIGLKTFACGPFNYTPAEYYMFYLEQNESRYDEIYHLNIEQWRNYTNNFALAIDVENVIYQYSIEDLLNIEKMIKTKKTRGHLYSNSFVKYLVKNKDKEAIDFLLLAKECSLKREDYADKWDYPTKKQVQASDSSLLNIIDKALLYKGDKLKSRYMLQAIRAAYTLEKYDLCLQIWNKYIKNLPESSVRIMCEDYIGGVYFHYGDYEKAISYYSNSYLSPISFDWCARNITNENYIFASITELYKRKPNSKAFPFLLQRICRQAEESANINVFKNDATKPTSYLNNNYKQIRDLALKIANEKECSNPAMWQYTAAFLTLMDGDVKLASKYTKRAKELKCSSDLSDKINILEIMTFALDGKYDKEFENDIIPKLKWLNKKIEENLTDEIKTNYDIWFEISNYSTYYYNDMMRKLILSIMAPKYIQMGKYNTALVLTGMVSENIKTLTHYRKRNTVNIDFSTDIFRLLDSLPTNCIIEYQKTLKGKYNSELEKYCAKLCYNNDEYLNEIIGTKYLREQNFELSIEYLSKVKKKYNRNLNIFPFFKYDPFQANWTIRRSLSKPTDDYKLNYAKRMLELKNKIKNEGKGENLAQYLYIYSSSLLAMKNCWALTLYAQSAYYKDPISYDYNSNWGKKIDSLLDKSIENTNNMELKVNCYIAKMWLVNDNVITTWYDENRDLHQEHDTNSNYNKFFQLLSLNYSSTKTYSKFRQECDLSQSYSLNNKRINNHIRNYESLNQIINPTSLQILKNDMYLAFNSKRD